MTFPDEWGVGRQLGVLFLPRRISIWRADFLEDEIGVVSCVSLNLQVFFF